MWLSVSGGKTRVACTSQADGLLSFPRLNSAPSNPLETLLLTPLGSDCFGQTLSYSMVLILKGWQRLKSERASGGSWLIISVK